MPTPSIVILGGGLSGIGSAIALKEAGVTEVTLVEASATLGGLAGSFEKNGHFYPLGYHHILHRDRALLYFLDTLGCLDRVRWRRVKLLFRNDEGFYDLGSVAGFLRFPMSLADKARFLRLMLRAFTKSDWSDWQDRSAADLVDSWGGPGVREAIFETLAELRFEHRCAELSGAWLGARLHFREGSAPLGYMPGANWTTVLCDGLKDRLHRLGVRIVTSSPVTAVQRHNATISALELADGTCLTGDIFVSTVPTEIYRKLIPEDTTEHLSDLRYSSLISAICAIPQPPRPEAYWVNLALSKRSACGIFLLSALNPSIGAAGESCVNFVTHITNCRRDLFGLTETELTDLYSRDFERAFDRPLNPLWWKVNRIPRYAPIQVTCYRNPPIRSSCLDNLFFAGNYRTFPSILSTGTALRSGVETGEAILRHLNRSSTLLKCLDTYRLRDMPKATGPER